MRIWIATLILAGMVTGAMSWTSASGASGAGADEASAKREAAQAHFDTAIAPLLARHCLECHGAASKKARLDLSRKETALAGGRSGKAIVPGQAAKSLLWKHLESGEMPPEGRPRLSAREKQLVRQWLDAGAVWSERPLGPLAVSDERIEPHREFDCSSDVKDPGPIVARRLTVPEYIATVRSAVGVDIEREARAILPRDVRADGFSNTAYNLTIDLENVEAYARLAQIIVARMDVAKFAAKYSKTQELNDDNMRRIIAGMGKRMLRGPLQEQEIAAFLAIPRAVAKEKGSFTEAVGFILEGMLQSPRFLHRIEDHQGDGNVRPVSNHELASRLSYILWGAPPDEELMRAADAGELSDKSRVEAQVKRMLGDPRAVEKSCQFIHEWMNLDQLGSLRPNSKRFPNWSPGVAADMRDETIAFFKHVAWEKKRPLSELLNARVTFATPRLAKHYGLDPKHAVADAAGGKPANLPQRVSGGLAALYTFEEGSGEAVHDVSGAGAPIHLGIPNPSAVRWSDQGLTVHAPALVISENAPGRLVNAVKKSKAITLEAWITPADKSLSGPARIVTLSKNISGRNFTLGQEKDTFDVRFRTNKTDANGQPSLTSSGGVVATRPTHVVYTRDASGKARLYVDGEERGQRDVAGDFSNWDAGMRLALGNEMSGDRPWRGTFHLVAVYSRALAAAEVARNYAAGARRDTSLRRYDLAKVPGRGGLLTQGSALTVGGDEASMVTRGLFVLNDFLCSKVDDPPPCVDTTPPPTKPGLTQRGAALARLANSACSGCHGKFEPLAFGLEKFDGVGAYHEKDEHGNQLREDGEIQLPGQDKPAAYKSSAELMDLLAGSERIRQSITLKVTQFALGRPLVTTDACALKKIHDVAWKRGGTYADLIAAVVMSDLVQMTRTERKR